MAEPAELTEQQIQEHQEQLAQVDELLALKPGDEDLLRLRRDLLKVLGMDQDLTALAAGAQGSADQHRWQVGERCTALWEDGKWYYAKIDAVADDEQYTVSYLDYGNTSIVPESSLKPYLPAPKDHLTKGQPVRAIWADDGLFYDAVVVDAGTLPGRFFVRFPQFGKKKYEVAAFDLVKRPGRKEDDPDAPLPEKAVIPEALKWTATDTEAQKEQKRRRIKRLKGEHRKRKLEEEGKKKQQSWQQFQKIGKFGFGKRKSSIFQSPESLDGRVGVVGSGNDMTAIPDRTKHRFRAEDQLPLPEE